MLRNKSRRQCFKMFSVVVIGEKNEMVSGYMNKPRVLVDNMKTTTNAIVLYYGFLLDK
jgi:hypothetical protein